MIFSRSWFSVSSRAYDQVLGHFIPFCGAIRSKVVSMLLRMNVNAIFVTAHYASQQIEVGVAIR